MSDYEEAADFTFGPAVSGGDVSEREARKEDVREVVRSLVHLAQSVSLTGCSQEERDVLANRSWRAIKATDALLAELEAAEARVRELENAVQDFIEADGSVIGDKAAAYDALRALASPDRTSGQA